MNISQSKQIPLHVIVEHLGGRFSKETRPGEKWYFSPFRPQEKTASFKIDETQNRWHDFGHVSSFSYSKSGGDILDLWCDYYNLDRKTGIHNALNDLSKFGSNISVINQPVFPVTDLKEENKSPRFKILKINNRILLPSLKEELQRRKVSLLLANKYLKHGYILDTKTQKKYNGFLFANDKNGYEISIPNSFKNQSFKTSTLPKAITTIKAEDSTVEVDIFEGFWDFLSWLQINKWVAPKNTTYILNTLSFSGLLSQNLVAQKHSIIAANLFLDNDPAGLTALHFFAKQLEQHDFTVKDRSKLYECQKDLNDYLKNSF